MNRIRNRKNKHKKIFDNVKGQRGANNYKTARQRFFRTLSNQFVSRKLIKRNFRSKWIKFINYKLKNLELKNSLFIYSLKKQKIILNRKMIYLILLKDLL